MIFFHAAAFGAPVDFNFSTLIAFFFATSSFSE
jgi:hypothetical protein